MTAERREKIVVLIPTRDRPNYLHLTVRSVLEQAQKFGHKMEVVVSDSLSKEENVKRVKASVESLQKQFPNTPIHYYGPGQPEPIKKLLASASASEKKAYEELVPKHGHYGAHRNRLSLLAIYHGGPNAAYLHLDDDTPLARVVERGNQGFLSKYSQDVFRSLLDGFNSARKNGFAGISISIMGVSDGAVSGYWDEPEASSLKSMLRKDVRHLAGHRMGPGRLTSADAAAVPYLPYGRNEDPAHAMLVSKLIDPHMAGLPYAVRGTEGIWLTHIGTKGHFLTREDREIGSKNVLLKESPEVRNWISLGRKMMRLKRRQSK
ncbi:glycosyltransferase family 2 protein [Candidatus Micrarchaeota archaeon]|nr:glycosyltransferase family 2 protein [Candidatus Micrarchaeota archaeon]